MVVFLKSANMKVYGKLLNSIREQHSFKIDVYPNTLINAYEMLSLYTTHSHNLSNYNKNNKETKPSNNITQPGATNYN